MTIICSWCTAYMGEKDGEGTTHTICASCKAKVLAETIRLANLRTIHAVEDAMWREE